MTYMYFVEKWGGGGGGGNTCFLINCLILSSQKIVS